MNVFESLNELNLVNVLLPEKVLFPENVLLPVKELLLLKIFGEVKELLPEKVLLLLNVLDAVNKLLPEKVLLLLNVFADVKELLPEKILFPVKALLLFDVANSNQFELFAFLMLRILLEVFKYNIPDCVGDGITVGIFKEALKKAELVNVVVFWKFDLPLNVELPEYSLFPVNVWDLFVTPNSDQEPFSRILSLFVLELYIIKPFAGDKIESLADVDILGGKNPFEFEFTSKAADAFTVPLTPIPI